MEFTKVYGDMGEYEEALTLIDEEKHPILHSLISYNYQVLYK